MLNSHKINYLYPLVEIRNYEGQGCIHIKVNNLLHIIIWGEI